MSSREFLALPMEKYPPYAARFQRSCIHWQELRHIALPTRGYLAQRFGMPNANMFTLIFEGRSLPTSPMVLSIARECEESVEEHLTVLNIDLAQRNRPSVDTFRSLIRFVEQRMGNDATVRDLLLVTQDSAWMHLPARWRDVAEQMLVSTQPQGQKAEYIARIIEASYGTGGHAPRDLRRVARA